MTPSTYSLASSKTDSRCGLAAGPRKLGAAPELLGDTATVSSGPARPHHGRCRCNPLVQGSAIVRWVRCRPRVQLCEFWAYKCGHTRVSHNSSQVGSHQSFPFRVRWVPALPPCCIQVFGHGEKGAPIIFLPKSARMKPKADPSKCVAAPDYGKQILE